MSEVENEFARRGSIEPLNENPLDIDGERFSSIRLASNSIPRFRFVRDRRGSWSSIRRAR